MPAMTNVLGPGQTLAAGRRLHAPTRPVTLVMQADGDLVLLKSGAEKLWAAGTAGKGATHAAILPRGRVRLPNRRRGCPTGSRANLPAGSRPIPSQPLP